MKGWRPAGYRTRLYLDARGNPAKVETTRYNLEDAIDEAGQHFGEPLERTGPWLTRDGRNPEDEDCGNNSKVTCAVATAASIHEGKEGGSCNEVETAPPLPGAVRT